MVLLLNMGDIFEQSQKNETLNLPAYKETCAKLLFKEFGDDSIAYEAANPVLPFAASDVFQCNVCSFKQLTPERTDKMVYEISLDVEKCNIKFRPGDTIGILPKNDPLEVDYIIEHLGLKKQVGLPYVLSSTTKTCKIPAYIPVRATLRYVLENIVDLRGVVKKLFLLALSKHTKDEKERRIIEYLCSKEGSPYYTKNVLEAGISIMDIFTLFKSCKPPIEVLLLNLPRLLPRPYSIANSQLDGKKIIKICFSVMPLRNNKKGLTTGYLENIINRDITKILSKLSISEDTEPDKGCIQMYLRKNMNNFSLPEDTSLPMLLIGPGTAVAPFMGFVQERQILKQENPNIKLGETWLYFGCRSPDIDFIYEKEMKYYTDCGIISKLKVAFSRVGSDVKYVQDLIRENGREVTEFIDSGATVFVCGDLKNLASEVRAALKASFVKYGGRSEKEAETFLDQLLTEKKYVADIWS